MGEQYQMDVPKELRITLASARVNSGLTQKETAGLMHVSKSTLVSWEKGKTSPSIEQAQRLCAIYNRPMDSILFGKESHLK